MKVSSYIISAILICCSFACKKGANNAPADAIPDQLNQSVVYKTVAVVPSPADYAKGWLKDSVGAFRSKSKDDPDFLTNIPSVSATISENFKGFSFGFHDRNKSVPYFGFSAYAFPDVPRQFQLNKAYEHTSIPGTPYQSPLFLGAHNGFDGMTYFVNNAFPPDADYPPNTTTYTAVTFTKKIRIPTRFSDSALLASGHIAGYCINYYKKTDTAKYVHRWNFTVDFTDMIIDR